MKRLLLLSTLAAVSLGAAAANKPEDFPLRVQIIMRAERTHVHNGNFDFSHGTGQANLFENSEPIGLDFSYSICPQPLSISGPEETLNARWKKKGEELTVLLPVLGKTDKYQTCDWKVSPKTVVYIRSRGALRTMSPADMKTWMQHHDFDPEHGKNQLKNLKNRGEKDE
ncbi:MAG: hypothetical protein JSS87_01050 [Acidobacteria bacterium]|nr:hypothetical protein [Acidobacteriota bacterium]